MSTTRIPAAETTGLQGALTKRIVKRTLGQLPSSLGVYWHDQKVLSGLAGLGGKVRKWDACDEALKTFAHRGGGPPGAATGGHGARVRRDQRQVAGMPARA